LVALSVNEADLAPQRKITESEVQTITEDHQIDVVKEISALLGVGMEMEKLLERLSGLILEQPASDGGGGDLTMSEESRPQNEANCC
jgi:hypothetical protein